MNQSSPPNFPFPVKSLPSLGLSILTRNGEGIKKGQTHGHRNKKAGVRWAMLALVEKPQHPRRCLLYRIQQGLGSADMGENAVCRGAVFRLPFSFKKAKLGIFYTHCQCLHMDQKGRLCHFSEPRLGKTLRFSMGLSTGVLSNGHANGKQYILM